MNEIELPEPIEFEWDQYNSNKVRLRHNINPQQAEQPFFSINSIVFDESHSVKEHRYQLIGPCYDGVVLFVVFTLRNNKVRIISARRANKKERNSYVKKT